MGKKKTPTRKSSRGLRGNSHSKQVKSLVLFAVEGATEKEYLKALNQHRYRGGIRFRFLREWEQFRILAQESSGERQAESLGPGLR